MRRPLFLFLGFLFFLPAISLAKELPKIIVWDLTSGDFKGAYAQFDPYIGQRAFQISERPLMPQRVGLWKDLSQDSIENQNQ
jgi:hypothetical protein